jgi:simple sugar transport system ATP-binding protein
MKLELRNISKRFGAVQANDHISLTVDSGRIVGILGENGAGKSTLMKILSGFQPADSGDIVLDSRPMSYHNAREAVAAGIGMLQQDPLDVGAFSVIENFLFGNDRLKNRAEAHRTLANLCGRFGFLLEPEAWIEQLSIAQRQQLEIVRLLALGVRVLILDEPTTGISTAQKHQLFATLQELARRDGLIVLLVSHKLEDVIALCDEVFVLRGGRQAGSLQRPFTSQQLVSLMFGDITPAAPRTPHTPGAEVLRLRGTLISRRLTVENVDFGLRASEVVGLAGLDGSGQELFLRALAGLVPVRGDGLRIGEQRASGWPYRHMMRRGVIFCAAGRTEEGLIAGMTLTEHTALMTERGLRANMARAEARTREGIARYAVKGTPESQIQQLSGGNQQRVLMSLLPDQPLALALEQPTRGLDIDSAQLIWQRLQEKRAAGAGIVFSSAELDEIIAYSDRILVFFAGRWAEVPQAQHITPERLGEMIGGQF